MKTLSWLASLLLVGSFATPAVAASSQADSIQLFSATKNFSYLLSCTSRSQMDCIESFGILRGPKGAEALIAGKEIDTKAKVIETCLAAGECATWEPEDPTSLWAVKTASRSYKYSLSGKLMNRNFSDKSTGQKGGAIQFQIIGVNGDFPDGVRPKVRLKVRTSWIKPFFFGYEGQDANWEFKKIRGGNLLTFEVLPQEVVVRGDNGLGNVASFFYVNDRLPKKSLRDYQCPNIGLFMGGTLFSYSRSRELLMSWQRASRTAQLEFFEVTTNPPQSGVLEVDEEIVLLMDTKYLSCVSKKAFSGVTKFLVTLTDKDNQQISATQNVTFAGGRLKIRLSDLPEGGFTLNLTAAR